MLNLLRNLLGNSIILGDRLFPAPNPVISEHEKSRRQSLFTGHVLYQISGCPFCLKVRRGMKRLGISMPLKNVNEDDVAKKELLAGGKTYQAPCLRIVDRWMYESDEILGYLAKTIKQDN